LDATHLGCAQVELRNNSGPALSGDSLQVGQDMHLTGGFTGSGGDGAVRVAGAHIGGSFDCTGAKLRNDSGPALIADSLQVGQGMYLVGGFTGSGGDGAVRVARAHIGGSFDCTGAKLHNDSGPALIADSLQVGRGMFLRGGFAASGSGSDGAIRLAGARIGGSFDSTGARLRNGSGPALSADGMQVDLAMFLRGEFMGSGSDGAVRLIGAHIGHQFDFIGDLQNESGPALMAGSLQVGQDMFLRGGFTGGGKDVAVDLTGARVSGVFLFAPTWLEHKVDPHRRLALNGLTYAGVPELVSPQSWRELLRDGTPRYAAQPYQQLAAGYQARGDDRQARETLMKQRDDQLSRAHTGQWERLWGRITKVTLGYGYQPWRALLFLVAVVAVSCVLAVVLGAHGALAQTSKTASPGRSCTVIQQVSMGLTLTLPVGTSVGQANCDLTPDSASTTSAWLTIAGWALRLLAWGFAALFVAGFTSAVRKT
jgi:hypothetical protein